MCPKLSSEAISDICNLVDHACADAQAPLPCASVVVVGNNNGSTTELLVHSAQMTDQEVGGSQETEIVIEKNEGPHTSNCDDIYWLASCTKLVTGIACMQLVQEGKIRLDDGNEIERICPELAEVKVLQEDGTLVDKTAQITLRMLLTHTAGFGYSFLNPKLQSYARQRLHQSEYNEWSGRVFDFHQPLVNQPGERFEYGINLDLAGIVVERVTGLKLNDYMQEHIFEPLDIHNLSMFPSPQMRERLIGLWQRSPNGGLSRRAYPMERSLDNKSTEDTFHSGGAGLWGSPREFSKILTALLCDGKSPLTGRAILSPDMVREMFTNQIPNQPNFARRHLPAVKPDLVYPVEELYPLCPDSSPQGWGLTFMISPGVSGRSDSTAHWSGLSNVFWWCDREKGVAGIVGSQVLPFVDPKTAELWANVETRVYKGLQ